MPVQNLQEVSSASERVMISVYNGVCSISFGPWVFKVSSTLCFSMVNMQCQYEINLRFQGPMILTLFVSSAQPSLSWLTCIAFFQDIKGISMRIMARWTKVEARGKGKEVKCWEFTVMTPWCWGGYYICFVDSSIFPALSSLFSNWTSLIGLSIVPQTHSSVSCFFLFVWVPLFGMFCPFPAVLNFHLSKSVHPLG